LLLATGAAAVVTGTVAGVIDLQNHSDFNRYCDASGACQPPGLRDADRGKTLVAINAWAWSIGAVASALGAYFVISSAPRVAAQAAPLPGGAAVALQGRF
jgi:hypothetical protein